jgi:hypothetical protein
MTCQIYDNSLFKKITIAITFQEKPKLIIAKHFELKKQLTVSCPFFKIKIETNFLVLESDQYVTRNK